MTDRQEYSTGKELPNNLTLVESRSIAALIYVVRGQQVMLDSDLAGLYGVETKRLNESVSRNKARFPEEFCFRLTAEELENLRSQIATSSESRAHGGKRHLPNVFTEQGIAMLSAVLRSDTAVRVSVGIMKAFVSMRHFLADNAVLLERIRELEVSQALFEKSTDERFELVFDYMESHEAPSQKIFFEGQVYDAFELLVSLVEKAESTIDLVDGYVDIRTLNILAKKRNGVAVTVFTSGKGLSQEDVDAFNAQYPTLSVRRTRAFHDRFLILDGKTVYHVGASLKDVGRKCFALSLIQDEEMVRLLVGRLCEIED